MHPKYLPLVAAIGVIALTCTSPAVAECSFGALCNHTLALQLWPVRTCINGQCSEPGLYNPIGFAYISDDDTVHTQFGTSSAPGISFNTFVCRRPSTKQAKRSCQAPGCMPDNPLPLDSMDFVDACSVGGDAGKLSIALQQSVHVYSTQSLYQGVSTDINAVIEVDIADATDPAKCSANEHASIKSTANAPSGSSSSAWEYFGSTNTPRISIPCKLLNGNQLPTHGSFGKVVDPGP
jgi:hypothetical protein